MSFFDLEAQGSRNPIKHDRNLPTGANDLINQFAEELRKLERQVSKIATKRDSKGLRDNIETGIIPLCSSLRDTIEELRWNNNGQAIPQGSKLSGDYQILKESFQRLEREYKNKRAKHLLRRPTEELSSKPAQGDSGPGYVSIQINEQTPLLREEEPVAQQQQQRLAQIPQDAVSQDELDFNTIIHQERSQQIGRIHGAVQEVNAIFHQLGSLVHEQGEQIDTIDGNIGNLSNNAQKANEQLNRADVHQRQRNKCGLITLVIIIVVVLVVILAVLS